MVVGASVAVVSCRQAMVSDAEGIVVSAEVTPATLSPGGTVDIRVVVTNAASSTRTVVGTTGCIAFREVRNPSGAVIASGDGRSCFADYRPYHVAAGDSLVDHLSWTAAQASGAQLPIGTYVVRVGVYPDSGPLILSSPYQLRVE